MGASSRNVPVSAHFGARRYLELRGDGAKNGSDESSFSTGISAFQFVPSPVWGRYCRDCRLIRALHRRGTLLWCKVTITTNVRNIL